MLQLYCIILFYKFQEQCPRVIYVDVTQRERYQIPIIDDEAGFR